MQASTSTFNAEVNLWIQTTIDIILAGMKLQESS